MSSTFPPSFDLSALIDDLIATDRDATDDEIVLIRQVVSSAGFDPNAISRVRGPLVGVTFERRVLARGDTLPNDAWHYAKHVVGGREWPAGTTISQYVSSLRQAIIAAANPILLDAIHGVPRLTLFGPAGASSGLEDREWIVVGYDVHYGYWTTGYQIPNDPEAHRANTMQIGLTRWLCAPR